MAQFVNLDNTQRRDNAYNEVIHKIHKDGVCPFCPEHLAKYHKKPIIQDGVHWVLTENMYPYKGAKHHILLIHKNHIEKFEQISHEAWDELQVFVKELIQKRNIKGSAFLIRSGETSYTGASVAHLHANVISPEDPHPGREQVTFRVG